MFDLTFFFFCDLFFALLGRFGCGIGQVVWDVLAFVAVLGLAVEQDLGIKVLGARLGTLVACTIVTYSNNT